MTAQAAPQSDQLTSPTAATRVLPPIARDDVRAFAAGMWQVLDRDGWQEIDPYFFQDLANGGADADDAECDRLRAAIAAGLRCFLAHRDRTPEDAALNVGDAG